MTTRTRDYRGCAHHAKSLGHHWWEDLRCDFCLIPWAVHQNSPKACPQEGKKRHHAARDRHDLVRGGQ